jgi:hypothetical protein
MKRDDLYRKARSMRYRKWKSTGGYRVIERPPDHVKIAQRLILNRLSLPESNAMGVQRALRLFQENIDEGFQWVASLDINDCFSSINPKKALAMIDTRVTEGVPGLYGRRSLPQGHPISPYLANLYLGNFDRKVRSWHIPVMLSEGSTTECRTIRYVDNVWIMCRRKKELELYLSRSLSYLGDMGLKTRYEVKHVNEHIDVLGHTVSIRSIRPNPRNVQKFKAKSMTYALNRMELEERLKNADNAESVEDTQAKRSRLDKDYNEFLCGWEAVFGQAMSVWLNRFLRGFNVNVSASQPSPLTATTKCYVTHIAPIQTNIRIAKFQQ